LTELCRLKLGGPVIMPHRVQSLARWPQRLSLHSCWARHFLTFHFHDGPNWRHWNWTNLNWLLNGTTTAFIMHVVCIMLIGLGDDRNVTLNSWL